MKKAWNVVLVIAFLAILLGAIAIGVGYLTGADLDQVYTTLENSPAGYAYAQQFIADFPAQFAGIF